MFCRAIRQPVVLFLTCSGISTAWSAEPRVWKPGASSEFEVGTQIRAWTIQDEGMEYALDTMQSMAAINSLYMVAVMHEEHRPYHAPEFPHNPARDTWEAEDSRVTFFPDLELYGKIKPALSDHEWLREKDWLRLMVKAARARGLAVGAEVSHFPIPKALVSQHPEWQMKTIEGKSWDKERFCPNHPDVREYLIALFGDLAANYDLDYIQTCQYLFNNKAIEDGGTCFCEHCIAEASTMGIDLKSAIPVLRKDPKAQPELGRWHEFRERSTARVYRDLSEVIHMGNPKCQLRLNDNYPWNRSEAIDYGLDLKKVAGLGYIESIVTADHQEQRGIKDEDFSLRKHWLTTNRNALGPDKPLISGIATRIEATGELVKRGIKVAMDHPAHIDGLALKHYDGASFSLLRAFRQGMLEAGLKGLTPALGLEVENMKLEGYAKLEEELAEEWGVETTAKGTATGTFRHPFGKYDLRLTYYDAKAGQSHVTVDVGGERHMDFKLDEDVGCWRWRTVENIALKEGDEIKLTGSADGEEGAVLDFIEFIPR